VVNCSANFPKAKSIKWNFGDGKSSDLFETQHSYIKPGTYTIIVTIQDSCGERIIKKKVIL
jgi:PKD repeat protein